MTKKRRLPATPLPAPETLLRRLLKTAGKLLAPVGVIAGLLYGYNQARAYVNPTRIGVICAICATPELITPPATADAPKGAYIYLFCENSGSSMASALAGNMTFLSNMGPLPEDFDFKEQPDSLMDKKVVPLGPHETVEFRHPLREEIILEMRRQVPGSPSDERNYLYGHIEYSDFLGIRHRRMYCFEYHPPEKNQVEGWDVCSGHNN